MIVLVPMYFDEYNMLEDNQENKSCTVPEVRQASQKIFKNVCIIARVATDTNSSPLYALLYLFEYLLTGVLKKAWLAKTLQNLNFNKWNLLLKFSNIQIRMVALLL